MIPDTCSDSTSSEAEKRTYRLLAQTEISSAPDAICFHSLNLSRHDYKIVGELDFVIVSRSFLIVLEVKGGGVAFDGNTWNYTDRYNKVHRSSEGPFQQAKSGMYALRNRLAERLGSGLIQGLVVGFGVVLPNTDFSLDTVEWDPPMVLDAARFRKAANLNDALNSLVGYWTQKRKQPNSLSSAQLEQMLDLLRPSFERFPSLRNRADDIDAAMEHLTEEQYRQLDFIARNDRILCSGGAGTGKTFLAVELARREARAGGAVGFLTSTPLQQRFVSSRIGDDRVAVASMDNLPVNAMFDVLIVDEGQDLVNVDDLATMDRILVGGLEHGRWRVFLDSNKQSGLVGRFDPQALDLLESFGFLGSLYLNCRNTHEIVLQTKLLTGADLGSPSAGHGPPVDIVYYDDDLEQLENLDAELERLRLDGVRPEDITVISKLTLKDSIAGRSRPARRRRLHDLTSADGSAAGPEQTRFCTIAQFKGLESQFVLIVDLESLDDSEYDINELYVAMSRARTGLWMSVNRRLESRAAALSRANLPYVMKDVHRAEL